MRDNHCTPLSYLLDKYQRNLYLDHLHHHHHSFHSPFHRKHHETINHELDDSRRNDEDDYAFESTRSIPIMKHSLSSYHHNNQRHETLSNSEQEEFNQKKNNSKRSIPIQEHHNSETKKEQVLLKDYLKKNQLRIVEATSNGNCLFNSISLALFDGEHKNFQLRQLCVDWIEGNLNSNVKDGIKIRDLIFLRPEQSNISDYLHDMRQEKEWADYCCLNALANLMECELEVVYVNYQDHEWVVKSEIQVDPINRNSTEVLTKIRLMYIEDLKHYNLLIKCK